MSDLTFRYSSLVAVPIRNYCVVIVGPVEKKGGLLDYSPYVLLGPQPSTAPTPDAVAILVQALSLIEDRVRSVARLRIQVSLL